MAEKCNIVHDHGGMRCVRHIGHDGLCWSAWAPMTGMPGRVSRGEWFSRDGKFYLHHQYRERQIGPNPKPELPPGFTWDVAYEPIPEEGKDE